MFVTLVFIIFLTALTITIHLEGLWLVQVMPRTFEDSPRLGVMAVVMTCLALHVIEIGFYAGGFMLGDKYFGVGQFNDETNLDAMAYFYYAAITFTAVGYGDILPTGDIRLLAVAESLNGLLMIGWSGAYTFIAMQKLWSDRANEKRLTRRAERQKLRDAQMAAVAAGSVAAQPANAAAGPRPGKNAPPRQRQEAATASKRQASRAIRNSNTTNNTSDKPAETTAEAVSEPAQDT